MVPSVQVHSFGCRDLSGNRQQAIWRPKFVKRLKRFKAYGLGSSIPSGSKNKFGQMFMVDLVNIYPQNTKLVGLTLGLWV